MVKHGVKTSVFFPATAVLQFVLSLPIFFFLFLLRAYDVGDPVYFVDDTGNEDWYIVTRINMLTTV